MIRDSIRAALGAAPDDASPDTVAHDCPEWPDSVTHHLPRGEACEACGWLAPGADGGDEPDAELVPDGGAAVDLFIKRSYSGRHHLYDAATVGKADDGAIIRALCGERAPVSLVEPFGEDPTDEICKNCEQSALADQDTEGDR